MAQSVAVCKRMLILHLLFLSIFPFEFLSREEFRGWLHFYIRESCEVS